MNTPEDGNDQGVLFSTRDGEKISAEAKHTIAHKLTPLHRFESSSLKFQRRDGGSPGQCQIPAFQLCA